MYPKFDIDIRLLCRECGLVLNTQSFYVNESRRFTFDVPVCISCSRRAYVDGRDVGYEDGYDTGYEDGKEYTIDYAYDTDRLIAKSYDI